MKLNINGEEREVDVAPDMPLLWALRDHLRLTGTKFGCGIAQCGACTVHVDGRATRACVTPVAGLEGKKIRTIEGLESEVAGRVQAAWQEIDVPQCGYCQSGQIMSAVALLEKVPKPSGDEIDSAMSGNICRCATYARIRTAIQSAAKNAPAEPAEASSTVDESAADSTATPSMKTEPTAPHSAAAQPPSPTAATSTNSPTPTTPTTSAPSTDDTSSEGATQ